MLARMILGIEDIAGGVQIASIAAWIGLTFLFYIVGYLAVLNIIEDFAKDSAAKIPLMLAAAVPMAFLMAIFNYKPIALFVLMAVANYFRVKHIAAPGNKRFQGLKITLPLFFIASYLYIFLVCILAYYFQMPVGAEGIPYWKTLLPEGPA